MAPYLLPKCSVSIFPVCSDFFSQHFILHENNTYRSSKCYQTTESDAWSTSNFYQFVLVPQLNKMQMILFLNILQIQTALQFCNYPINDCSINQNLTLWFLVHNITTLKKNYCLICIELINLNTWVYDLTLFSNLTLIILFIKLILGSMSYFDQETVLHLMSKRNLPHDFMSV